MALDVDPEGLLHEPNYLNEEERIHNSQRYGEVRQGNGWKMCRSAIGYHCASRTFGYKETLNEWERIHIYINSYLIRGELHEKQSRLAEVLASSYHDLSYQLKPCFLYLSQFPENSEIPTNKLIRLWIAEGVVSSQYEIQRDETMEDVAECYLGEMGSTGRIKTCRLHDLMHDLCLSKATQESFLHITSNSQQNMMYISSSSNQTGAESTVAVRRLAVFLDEHVDQLIPFNQHRRSLLYFHEKKCRMENWQIIKDVVESFKLLRVLDLEGI
ncbi:hypothetical protein L6164_012115 [Bauhinia variegata]|uniref:Uncharacterized protein n=1 Tax=Bauhinia variegata TaxID=167791 RepID=A0ACB9P943_BAUVA|nr:hypothetical protein L6164_012115 [Bauhinia variegata]